jgi:hypothetical protein
MKKLVLLFLFTSVFAVSSAVMAAPTEDIKINKLETYKKYYSYYRHKEFNWAIGPYVTFIPGLAVGGTFKYNFIYPWSLNVNFSLSSAGNNNMGFYIGPNFVYNFYIYDLPQLVPYIGGGAGIYSANKNNIIGIQVNGGTEFFVQKNISLYADLGIAVNLSTNLNFGAKWYFK